jgi:concentrative nucleoside transporter, CNT family
MDIYNLISFIGIFILMAIAWTMSAHRRTINWRVIVWGTLLQLLFAVFIFQVPAGAKVFLFVNDAVVKLLDSASAGTRFVFGRLALPPGTTNEAGETSLGFILAFQAFPTIIFFSALMSILYYWKIMPLVIRGFAWVFTKLMRVSGAESLCTAANIFVGIESSLTVRPLLEKMTKSELCVVLTSGMATVASNVLVLYVFCLQKQFPNIAGHLVSASILGAPAALVMSKIIFPETEKPETLGVNVQCEYPREKSLFEAIINGANAGVQLIVGIVALLLAVLGLVALVDLLLGAAGWRLNALVGWHVEWTLRGLLGYLFYPLTLVIGVHPSDAWTISKIIGERTVATEVAGYQDLATALANKVLCYPGRSAVLATYALCGFAHVASMAIFVGGTAALAPSRAGDLTKVALRALIAATLACLMIACVAGVFLTGDNSILLGTAR